MRAAVLYGPGPPESFTLEDVPMPSMRPDEVLVRVAACGVSFKDIVERNGVYKRDMAYPAIIGSEIAGRVVECGSNVRTLDKGDMICTKAFGSCGYCRLCRSGRETTCRQRQAVRGGYGEFAAVPSDACVRLSESISPEVGCSLGLGSGVALNAVRDTARVSLGESVLVTGASGGVGLPAMQIAKAAGARVIALTRDGAKHQRLIQDGAHDVIVASGDHDFSESVKRLTDDAGVDVVIDTVGSKVFSSAFSSLAVHGRYVMVGQLSSEEVLINPARIFFKRASILGVGSVSRAQLEDAIALVKCSLLRPCIDRLLPLEDVAEAHRLVESGRTYGRIVISML